MRITKKTLKSFLVSLLGILTAEVGFSNGRQNGSYDDCYNVTGEEICYYFISNGETNWNTAHGKCQNINSSLPIIRNRKEQTAIEAYIGQSKSKLLSINAVWTSGKKITYDWTWNNGQTLNTTITISNGYSAEKTHVMFDRQYTRTENKLKPERPLASAWYLCQYKDRQCSGQQHKVNATNGCLIPSEYGNVSWYEARNECLSKGGDLAVLTDQDLHNLKMHRFPNNNYWIGLRKVKWVWKTSSQASPEEVKYTNWANEGMPTERDLCISIYANNGKWRAAQCSSKYVSPSVICEKREKTQPSTMISSTIRRSAKIKTIAQTTASKTPSTTSTTRRSPITSTMNKHNDISSASHSVLTTTDSTSGKFTTATTAGNSHTTTVTAAATMSQQSNVSSMIGKEMNDSAGNINPSVSSTVLAAIGAGVVIAIVILCIIVILVVKCQKSKSSNNQIVPAQTDSETTKDKKTKENPATTTRTEEGSIYADIPLAEKTANDAPEAGQKGTVYASLDFNQGVTYAEPSTLYAVTKNTQNVSGAIYAEPLNATENGATSAGSSQAVKIGPMGDVYALPMTNVTPSSDKTTERPIYANT